MDDWKLPPKNRVTFCNDCNLRKMYTATCQKYPDGIPHEVMIQKTPCKEFELIKGLKKNQTHELLKNEFRRTCSTPTLRDGLAHLIKFEEEAQHMLNYLRNNPQATERQIAKEVETITKAVRQRLAQS